MSRVYLGDVPVHLSVDDIRKEIYAQFKGVVNITVEPGAEGLGNKGVAFVQFDTPNAAKMAVSGGVMLGGSRPVFQLLDESKPSLKRPADTTLDESDPKKRKLIQNTSRALLVSGFPIGTDGDALKKYFSTQGEVEKVELHHPSGGANRTPFALVYMSYPHVAERAKRELDGNLFRGSSLSVDFAFEDVPENNPIDQQRVHIALDASAPGNVEISIGKLLSILGGVVENPNHGAFVDPNGHVIIPVTAFPADDDNEDEESEVVSEG